ncbi:MAG: hypothetical protein ACE5KT_11420 [Methanosarcinales archaeon]
MQKTTKNRIETQIIQKLKSKDKDEILDIPTIMLNECIDFEVLMANAIKEKVLQEVLAMIEIANILEKKDRFKKVLCAHHDKTFSKKNIEDSIFPYSEFRKVIKRSFLEDIENKWNVNIAFTLNDFYKIYRDYHLIPYHNEQFKRYFGDALEI